MAAEILVTGATGNVGREVVASLTVQGIPVAAGDFKPIAKRDLVSELVEPRLFSFNDPETWTAAFAGVRRMFVLRPPQIANVQKELFPALDAATRAGVEHFVFLSIINVEALTSTPHYKIEGHLRNLGRDWTFLRSSFFMQNLNTTHRDEIRLRNELFLPVGNARTSFIDARDVGAVAALTLSQPGHAGQAYDITGSEALDYDAVAALFSRALGRTIHYRNPSPLRYLLRQLRQGKALPFAVVTTWLYGNTRRGMAERVTGEVERLLGRPPIRLAQYIEDYKTSWQS